MKKSLFPGVLIVICAVAASVVIASSGPDDIGHEPIIGGPCEGCEHVFTGLPGDLSSSARIAPEGEPGESLIVRGTVTTLEGHAASDIIVYAYQTDAEGVYPDASTRHGRLRAWAMTDEDGQYEFHTIRPAAYPGSSVPQHIHMHIIEPQVATYYIDDIHFLDDPLLTDRIKGRFPKRGGGGVRMPEKKDGVWHVRRDIVLGLNVPGR